MKELYVRLSDNVLELEDWPVAKLTIQGNSVKKMEVVCKGAYDLPNMVGWTLADVAEWSRYDSTGYHPEEYHDVSSDACTWSTFCNKDDLVQE